MNNNIETNYNQLLEIGQLFKNYRALCEYLGEEVKTGNSKMAHVKNWQQHFNFIKEGHKIVITDIYEKTLERVDYRKTGNNKVKEPLSKSHPLLAAEWIVSKNSFPINDKITRRTSEQYWWKCSKCQLEIYQAPSERVRYTPFEKGSFACEFCSLSNGAKRIYLFLKEYNLSFKLEVSIENLIGVSGRVSRFDFGVYDEKENLLTLIEYDGEYHDENLNPCSDNYNMISIHDKRKDDYCQENNIPLLRIHHSEIEEFKQLTFMHFKSLGLEKMLPKDHLKLDETVLNKWLTEIEVAKNKINELEQFIDNLQVKLEVWS